MGPWVGSGVVCTPSSRVQGLHRAQVPTLPLDISGALTAWLVIFGVLKDAASGEMGKDEHLNFQTEKFLWLMVVETNWRV